MKNKILDWKVYSLIGKKIFRTCILTEIIWSDKKTFMLNKNMYSVWNMYAKGKYICSFKKYALIESIFDVLKNILWLKNICGNWIIL